MRDVSAEFIRLDEGKQLPWFIWVLSCGFVISFSIKQINQSNCFPRCVEVFCSGLLRACGFTTRLTCCSVNCVRWHWFMIWGVYSLMLTICMRWIKETFWIQYKIWLTAVIMWNATEIMIHPSVFFYSYSNCIYRSQWCCEMWGFKAATRSVYLCLSTLILLLKEIFLAVSVLPVSRLFLDNWDVCFNL